jgi:hypothetical protein
VVGGGGGGGGEFIRNYNSTTEGPDQDSGSPHDESFALSQLWCKKNRAWFACLVKATCELARCEHARTERRALLPKRIIMYYLKESVLAKDLWCS